MSAIIKVENLGKKYLINHEQSVRYTALRDVITQKVKKIFSLPTHLKPAFSNNTTEEFWALKGVDFEIQQGDRVGIIGRNGAGKSTLLKILSRITEPTTGRIELNGRVASLLEVGTGFHPELTGRENIYLNGAILGMSRSEIRDKFDEIVAFSGVEKFLDTPVKRYSSGMYVRLAFSVAAHLEPEILVVDEVLAVGDADFQKKCLGKMQDISQNDGRTVIFVSHNVSAIQSLCSKSIVLSSGKMDFIGDCRKGIDLYMGSAKSEKVIFPLTNADAQILSAEIISPKVNGLYAIEEVLQVQVTYECRLNGMKLSLSLAFFDRNGTYVLNSPSINDTELSGKSHTAGVFIGTFTLPANILNVEIYYASILLIEDYAKVLEEKSNALCIETTMSNPEAINNYFGYWPGIVRPQTKWVLSKKS